MKSLSRMNAAGVGDFDRLEAFDRNRVAPAGPDLDAFEAKAAEAVGVRRAMALSSGTCTPASPR